jgi:hypothetical protein
MLLPEEKRRKLDLLLKVTYFFSKRNLYEQSTSNHLIAKLFENLKVIGCL